MPNCPKCGAEVKKGFKFCLACGAPIQAGANQASPAANPASQQMYTPVPPKKSNTKLIFGLIAIIAIVVIVIAIALVLMGGSGASQFEGTWDVQSMGIDTGQWTFYGNGTMTYTYDFGYGEPSVTWSTWRVENNKFYLGPEMDFIEMGYNYEFSNGGNTLILKYSSITAYTLTRVQ